MTPDPREIAKRLSDAQRAMILRARREWPHTPHRCWGWDNTKKALRERGLAYGDFAYLTPLGLAVRDVLREEGDG